MSHERALARVRTFLHVIALGLFMGTIGELLMVKHYGEPLKLVPFALCGAGCLAIVAAWRWPRQLVLLGVRGLMLGTMAGSLVGVYAHIEGNLASAQEIHRHATTVERIKQVLTGRNPIAAPGMLAVATLLLIAATYVTSALASPERSEAVAERREPTRMRTSQTA